VQTLWRGGRPNRKRGRILAISALAAALVIALSLLAAAVPFSSEILRDRIVSTLSERLNSDVTLGKLELRLFPRMHATGRDLVIRQRDRGDVPPLITVKRFEVQADLTGLLRKRVAHVRLAGLDIQIPPGRDDAQGVREAGRSREAGEAGETRRVGGKDGADDVAEGVIVDAMDTKDARLSILSSRPNKPAKVWNIHTLHMERVGVGSAMPYQATLTNALPPGQIVTEGSFGPWDRDEPGRTPLEGTYVFEKADLSVFKGIAGTLASTGSFSGMLRRIDARGETETPDFTINLSRRPFPLRARFHSIIDGTSGDTILERIDASFLDSSLVATGSVADRTPDDKGRTVQLDVQMERARIEDLMQMAVKSDHPPMAGALQLATRLILPPGEKDVAERLELDGQFAIASAQFTSYDVQGKIDELSRRGRGLKASPAARRVVSNFEGRFQLADGVLRLPALRFDVPGAAVQLAGAYALAPETLDFRGQLLLDAKLSQTTTGFKSLLLRAVDPLFRQKDGTGSALPIKIAGRRDAPQFGLDVRRALRRAP
jgi:hypothetical protein